MAIIPRNISARYPMLGGVTALLFVLMASGLAVGARAGRQSAPAAPTDLTAHWARRDPDNLLTGVVLNWKPVPGATSYNIYRALRVLPRPAPATKLLKQGVQGTTYLDDNIGPGVDTTFVYQVTAVNAQGESGKSSPATPQTLAPPPPPPGAPVIVVLQGKITAVTGQTLQVKTPDIHPASIPGRPHPHFVQLGPTYVVDLTGAVFQTANGQPGPVPTFQVGDAVIVVGERRSGPNSTRLYLKATVIERAQPVL